MRLFRKNYFSKTGYANDRLGTVESVQSFRREDVLSFYRKMVSPHHSVLAIYGDMDPAAVSARVREKLGAWSGKAVPLPKPADETRQITEDRTIDKTKSCFACSWHQQDRFQTARGGQSWTCWPLSGPGIQRGSFRPSEKKTLSTWWHILQQECGLLRRDHPDHDGKPRQVQGIILANLRLAEARAGRERKVKNMMLVSLKLARESLDSQAQNAAINEVLGLGGLQPKYSDLVRAVTAEQVRRWRGFSPDAHRAHSAGAAGQILAAHRRPGATRAHKVGARVSARRG
jgi:zinc protease